MEEKEFYYGYQDDDLTRENACIALDLIGQVGAFPWTQRKEYVRFIGNGNRFEIVWRDKNCEQQRKILTVNDLKNTLKHFAKI